MNFLYADDNEKDDSGPSWYVDRKIKPSTRIIFFKKIFLFRQESTKQFDNLDISSNPFLEDMNLQVGKQEKFSIESSIRYRFRCLQGEFSRAKSSITLILM